HCRRVDERVRDVPRARCQGGRLQGLRRHRRVGRSERARVANDAGAIHASRHHSDLRQRRDLRDPPHLEPSGRGRARGALHGSLTELSRGHGELQQSAKRRESEVSDRRAVVKAYLVSLAVGLLVGAIYGFLNVRSPAPPVIALIGLLGILIGEQAPALARRVLTRERITVSWLRNECGQHIFGALPGRRATGTSEAPTLTDRTP